VGTATHRNGVLKMKNILWAEKHRPTKLKEMILEDSTNTKMKEYIEEGEIPHLLFYGPPGSGKTTISQIIINELRAVKLVLNASSSDRGIGTVKGKIKQFASSMSSKLKIVFLDEADAMTADAQRALRNTMETYSKGCRFILTANYVDKIIPAIQSRCTLYEMESFSKGDATEFVIDILDAEKITFDEDDVETIVDMYYPDIRTTINNLQRGCTYSELDLANLKAITMDLEKIKALLVEGQIGSLRKMWAGLSEFTFMYKYFFDKFFYEYKGDVETKTEIIKAVADYMADDPTVPDREVNMTACCVEIMGLMGAKIKF